MWLRPSNAALGGMSPQHQDSPISILFLLRYTLQPPRSSQPFFLLGPALILPPIYRKLSHDEQVQEDGEECAGEP